MDRTKLMELREIEINNRALQITLEVTFRREADFDGGRLIERLLEWKLDGVYDVETGADVANELTERERLVIDSEIRSALSSRVFRKREEA